MVILLIQVNGMIFTSRTLREMFEGLGKQVSERSLIISRIDGDKLLTWEYSLCIKQLHSRGKKHSWADWRSDFYYKSGEARTRKFDGLLSPSSFVPCGLLFARHLGLYKPSVRISTRRCTAFARFQPVRASSPWFGSVILIGGR